MGIELVYTPVYSPNLNPIESCFGKVKAALNGDSQGGTRTKEHAYLPCRGAV
mgnify:CR=1 FL=1